MYRAARARPKRGRGSRSGRPSPPRGRRAANGNASSAATASSRNAARGPANCATIAPATSPLTGPAAMIERIVPLRRAAPVGSAVASACVATFIAAKARPHSSRATSSTQTPDPIVYPMVASSAAERRQQTGRPRAVFAIKPRDPAIPGDPHEPVGGEQQPGFGEADPERVVMQRQQQIKQRIAGLGKGERQRRVARIAVGRVRIGMGSALLAAMAIAGALMPRRAPRRGRGSDRRRFRDRSTGARHRGRRRRRGAARRRAGGASSRPGAGSGCGVADIGEMREQPHALDQPRCRRRSRP